MFETTSGKENEGVKQEREKLLVIIDGHAILHRAFHALPPLTNSKGQIVNAVYGFISIFLKVVEDLRPTHLAVVFDRPAPTFRKKMFADYQIQRPEMDKDMVPQIELVHKVLSEMEIPIYEMDGYEADDLIGTIVQRIKKEQGTNKHNIKSIIVTGDRDILQLVDENTKVYMPQKGLSQAKLYGEQEVIEKLGIKPGKVVEYKGLVGDASDNYPGVAGIGPKTAINLLEKYGTVEGIYSHLGQIKSQAVKEKLEKNKDVAFLSKKLATIMTDVPFEFYVENNCIPDFNNAKVRWLFEEMEFKSLMSRLEGNGREQIINNKEQGIGNKKQKDNDVGQQTLF